MYWNEQWHQFQFDLEKLANFTDDLKKGNESQQLRQSQLSVAPRHFDVIDIEAACVVSPTYHNINDVILHSLEYEVIHADQFASTDKSKRYLFFKNLQLSRPVQLYRYHQSGSLGMLNFIWAVPGDHRQRKHSKMVAIIEEIKHNIPTYHMRRV